MTNVLLLACRGYFGKSQTLWVRLFSGWWWRCLCGPMVARCIKRVAFVLNRKTIVQYNLCGTSWAQEVQLRSFWGRCLAPGISSPMVSYSEMRTVGWWQLMDWTLPRSEANDRTLFWGQGLSQEEGSLTHYFKTKSLITKGVITTDSTPAGCSMDGPAWEEYIFRVRAQNDSGWSEWSELFVTGIADESRAT